MKQRISLLLCVAFIALTSGLYAAKKTKTPPAQPAIPQMTADQKALHALNRLTFGARPGDLEEVKRLGLDNWLDQQLHPETIAENPVLEAKLQPLDTLRMNAKELVRHYPPPQIIKAMVDGRQPLPSDPETRFMVQKLIVRYERKQKGDAAGNANASADLDPKISMDSLALTADQKQVLKSGKPGDKIAAITAMPEEEQWQVLDAMPNGARLQLYKDAPTDLRRRIQIFSGPLQVVNQDLMAGKLLGAIYSNRQLEQVLTDFWYNHFNVDIDKGADKYLVTGYEREIIRPNVLGRFKDLLLATAKSPAMLFYLDNWQSVGPDFKGGRGPAQKRKQGLNENYGRELMELHTLGVDGGYTQQDVTEVARCFTGWTIAQPQQGGGFTFNPRQHDSGEKHVLGTTIAAGGGMDDGLKVIDILAHSPATAHFISRSLALRFVSDNPPEALVKKMSDTFLSTDGDLRQVMHAMVAAPEFWDPANFRSKVKSPLEMVAGAVRAVNGDVDFASAMNNLMTQLGEPLYRKLEPTGYSNRSTDWLNSASLLARMNFAIDLTQGKINGVKVDQTQFAGDPLQVERRILMADPTADAQNAIDLGMKEQEAKGPTGSLVAGLALGSPDFQRR